MQHYTRLVVVFAFGLHMAPLEFREVDVRFEGGWLLIAETAKNGTKVRIYPSHIVARVEGER